MNIKIYVGLNSGLPNLEKSVRKIETQLAAPFLSGKSVEYVESPKEAFEFPTLHKCWLDSQSQGFYGLYLHGKGASKTTDEELNNGLAWLDYMLVGLLGYGPTCIDHLNKGADLVGSMWYRHFKGNCFWFKSSYVRALNNPLHLDVRNRYLAEYWCSQAYWFNPAVNLPRIKNLFYLPIKTDSDFLPLSEEGYTPNLDQPTICNDLSGAISRNDFSVYDQLYVSSEELEDHKKDLPKYINYDSTIILK